MTEVRIGNGKRSRKYDIKKKIKNSRLARYTPKKSAAIAYNEIVEEYETPIGKRHLFPGQLVVFKYQEPKTKEELLYYDALPCTVFFGVANTKQGRRVVGLNLHYFPRYARKQIMYQLLKVFGLSYDTFDGILKHAVPGLTWSHIKSQVSNLGLEFGVKMYIPSLIGDPAPVPVKDWHKAFYTEGAFKKKARTAVMKLWEKYMGPARAEKRQARKEARERKNVETIRTVLRGPNA